MDAVWWKWLDINYGSKPCVERAWWDLLEVVKMVMVPAGIESIYNCMFFKYYFLFSLLGTIMDTIRR